MEGLRGPDGIDSVTFGKTTAKPVAEILKKSPNSVWAIADKKGAKSGKLDIPTQAPSQVKAGDDYNSVAMQLTSNYTNAFPKTKKGATYSETKLYEGGTLSADQTKVKGGKFVATIITDGDKRTIVDAEGHKFVAGADGKLKPES